MILTEFEGKQLLAAQGLKIPKGVLVSQEAFSSDLKQVIGKLQCPAFVKAQVLHGNRALQGLVKEAHHKAELEKIISDFFSQKDSSGQPISQVLIEEAISFENQKYVALTYSTRSRSIIAQYSTDGGEGMDERGSSLKTQELSILSEPTSFEPAPALLEIIKKLWRVFVENDATLVEINPLVKNGETWFCLDAKIEVEDVAAYRHPEWEQYPKRSDMGRPPTKRETQAHQVSRSDHRGVAGESFFEFPGGEIGVLAAGGGASILAMDALLAHGLKPANYTEHSGNPPREKVKALTDVILSIPNLKGLFVVGTNANFTDIYETLSGVVDSLLEHDLPNQFPVLFRRGGPRWQEAFAMIDERLPRDQFKVKTFGPDFPIVKTASEMKELIK